MPEPKESTFDPVKMFKEAEAELERGVKRQTVIKTERGKLDDENRNINERAEVLRRIVGAKEKRTHSPKKPPSVPTTLANAGVSMAGGSANGPVD